MNTGVDRKRGTKRTKRRALAVLVFLGSISILVFAAGGQSSPARDVLRATAGHAIVGQVGAKGTRVATVASASHVVQARKTARRLDLSRDAEVRLAAVSPVVVPGNPSCAELGYDLGFKVDPPRAGVYVVPDVGTITVTRNGEAFSWTSTFGVDAVIAKGGPNANLYVYAPSESFGDVNLVSPDNGGQPFGLSHIEFCYDLTPPQATPGAFITIGPGATNAVGDAHTFTVHVEADDDVNGGAGFAPVAGLHPVISLSASNGAQNPVPVASNTCATTGTDAGGNCTITFTSASAGQVIGHAAVDVLGLHRETTGVAPNSADAVKTFVDSYITISPSEATNPTNTTHVFTAQVFVDDGAGSGFVAAPNGTLVTFTLLPGSVGSFVGGNTCTTTAGACSVTTTSATAGDDTMQASATVTVGGVTMTRTTGVAAPAHANSGNAVKHWVSSPPPANPTSPSIAIVKAPDVQVVPSGGTATWTITVTNTGNVTLANVRVTDAQAPGCARTQADIAGLASLAPGASVDYTCSRTNVTGDFTNVAVATGTPPQGGDVTANDDARVVVLVPGPSISIAKTPDRQELMQGATATFTITVSNSGQVTLSNVRVTDAQAPGCARTQVDVAGLATMAPGASVSYTCTLANVQATFTNVAIATGTPPTGGDVTDDDDAQVTVRIPHPAITIVKNPKSQTISSGGTATFQITVTNTGDVELTNVTVTDASTPDCNRSLGTLAPGQSAPTYTCTRPNVTAAFDNVAVAAGVPAVGSSVSATDAAPVTVTAPFKPLAAKPKPRQQPKVVTNRKPRVAG